MHGRKPIEGASKSLQMLNEKAVPWILLTNGGGRSEADRVRELSDYLGVKIHLDQFCQSHTPFKSLRDRYQTIMVSGGRGDVCKQVAKQYGFKDVIQPVDILASCPDIWPFCHEPIPSHAQPRDFSKVKIDAIFVFNDPRYNTCVGLANLLETGEQMLRSYWISFYLRMVTSTSGVKTPRQALPSSFPSELLCFIL